MIVIESTDLVTFHIWSFLVTVIAVCHTETKMLMLMQDNNAALSALPILHCAICTLRTLLMANYK